MEKQIGDILVQLSYKESEQAELNQWRNKFQIVLKNTKGEVFERGYDTYSKPEKQTDVSEQMFYDLLSEIVEACYVNSESYDSFEEWCWDFGYDENEEENKDIYVDSVEMGNQLLNVVSEEWLENMDVYFKLSEK
jgi:hypothetical protein